MNMESQESRTVLENLLVMAPQATAIGILILVAMLGLFLGACAFLFVTGWRIGKVNTSVPPTTTGATEEKA